MVAETYQAKYLITADILRSHRKGLRGLDIQFLLNQRFSNLKVNARTVTQEYISRIEDSAVYDHMPNAFDEKGIPTLKIPLPEHLPKTPLALIDYVDQQLSKIPERKNLFEKPENFRNTLYPIRKDKVNPEPEKVAREKEEIMKKMHPIPENMGGHSNCFLYDVLRD
jgi:hypothetical protein